MKMISNDLRSSCRAMLLGAYQGGGDTPSEEKWQYPSDWLPLPDVAENEVAALIFVRSGGEAVVSIEGDEPEYVDWGDPGGTEETYINLHRYSYERGTPFTDNTSMFVLKVHYPQDGGFKTFNLQNSYCFMAACAVNGSAIKIGGSASLLGSQTNYLQYIRITGDMTNFENSPGFIYDYNALKRVDFENSPTVLPNATLCSCYSLRSVNLPDLSRVTAIGNSCFNDLWAVTRIDLPMLQSAGYSCFKSNYSLKTINLPNVQSIGGAFLMNCTAITEVHLPALQTIGSSALNYCYGLESVEMEALTAVTGNSIGSGCGSLRKINMPNIDITQSGIFPDSYMIK